MVQVGAALEGFEAGSLKPGAQLQAFDHVYGTDRRNDTPAAVLYGAIKIYSRRSRRSALYGATGWANRAAMAKGGISSKGSPF